MGRKKEPEKAANHERWLVSYADFITLLFAFFVVMFASSNEDKDRQKQMEEAISTAFNDPWGVFPGAGRMSIMGSEDGGMSGHNVTISISTDSGAPISVPTFGGESSLESNAEHDYSMTSEVEIPDEFKQGGEEGDGWDLLATPTPTPTPTPAPTARETPNVQALFNPTPAPTSTPGNEPHKGIGSEGSPEMREVYENLQRILARELAEAKIAIRQEKRGIVISLSEAGFFDLGSAELKSRSLATIDRIAAKLSNMNRDDVAIRVEGHTDNIPLSSTGRYRDNLELSTARANSVIYRLIRQHGFDPRHLIASGYGEWRPVASNDTERGRARNRRVDLVLLSDEYAGMEPN